MREGGFKVFVGIVIREFVETVSEDAARLGPVKSVLFAVPNLKCPRCQGDRVLQIIVGVAAHSIREGLRKGIGRHRPVVWMGLERVFKVCLVEQRDGLFEIVRPLTAHPQQIRGAKVMLRLSPSIRVFRPRPCGKSGRSMLDREFQVFRAVARHPLEIHEGEPQVQEGADFA